METTDLTAQNIEKIGTLFPGCITETKDENGNLKKTINFDLLRQILSYDVNDGDETYEFTWVGKKAAIVEAYKPIQKTLRPCKDESVDWNSTKNLYIEGDNLEVLKLLQESYLGKVKLIYIDPPYNTGNDFIYADNFKMSNEKWEEKTDKYDEEGNRLFRNTDGNGRFHSDWCSMIYSRLILTRTLLADDGVIFISIDDNEVQNLRNICDEVFGRTNFIAMFPRLTTKSGKTPLTYMVSHDYVLCYTKIYKDIFVGKDYQDDSYKYEDEYVNERGKYNLKQPLDCNSISYSKSLDYPIEHDGVIYYPGSDYDKYLERQNGKFLPKDYAWRWSKDLFEFGLKNGWIVFQNGRIYTKGYLNATIEKIDAKEYQIVTRQKTRKFSTIDFIANNYSNDIAKKQLASYGIPVKFDYPKPIDMLKDLLTSYYKKDALVMDFFSGSGTIADAVFRQNLQDGGQRNFICIQYPETVSDSEYSTICEIGKERIRRAGTKIKAECPLTTQDIDVGFRVFKLADSNMTDVYYKPNEYSQKLLSSLEMNIKPDRTDLDLFFGCILDWGLELSRPYKSEQVDGCTIHLYIDGKTPALIACFDEHIPESVLQKIAKLQPLRAVFWEQSFPSSAEKISVGKLFKVLSPDTRVKML